MFKYLEIYALYGATAANPSRGVLTVNLNGTWGTVCGSGREEAFGMLNPIDAFGMEEANAACRGLGYRHAIFEVTMYDFDGWGIFGDSILYESYSCRKSYER